MEHLTPLQKGICKDSCNKSRVQDKPYLTGKAYLSSLGIHVKTYSSVYKAVYKQPCISTEYNDTTVINLIKGYYNSISYRPTVKNVYPPIGLKRSKYNGIQLANNLKELSFLLNIKDIKVMKELVSYFKKNRSHLTKVTRKKGVVYFTKREVYNVLRTFSSKGRVYYEYDTGILGYHSNIYEANEKGYVLDSTAYRVSLTTKQLHDLEYDLDNTLYNFLEIEDYAKHFTGTQV